MNKYFPEGNYNFPSVKVSDADYLKQLKEDNLKLKETLSTIFPRDISGVVVDYFPSPEQIDIRRYLEARLPHGMMIGDYLGLQK